MRRWITIVAALACGLALPLAAEQDTLAALGWISGTWEGESGQVRMEEHWTRPAGGLMLGLHRDLFPKDRAFFEFLRIERRGEDMVYVAMPLGKNETAFRLTELQGHRAVFENPEHDFPQRIVYVREGDTLRATVEGSQDGERRSSSWQWRRVRPK